MTQGSYASIVVDFIYLEVQDWDTDSARMFDHTVYKTADLFIPDSYSKR